MEEKIFYEKDGVKVTSARFIVHQETYPIVNISSVKQRSDPPKNGCGVVLMAFGGLFAFAAMGAEGETASMLLIGLLMGGIGWGIWKSAKAEHIVILNTAGNDVKALKSFIKEDIDNVIKALNDAIVHRG